MEVDSVMFFIGMVLHGLFCLRQHLMDIGRL